ncbi:MAG: Mu transposase C-terminal domain-containing protein, partial [Desulfobacterium sp.]|nr:Mu transposase C-terminal domain-containing protein [Desulfobacterium sp.]
VMDRSEKAVRIRAEKEEWPTVKRIVRGGSNWYFPKNLLPPDVREKLTMSQTEERGLKVIEEDKHELRVPINVPDKAKQIGLAKFQLVQAWRSALDAAPWGKKKDAAEAFLLAYNSGRLMPAVFTRVGEVAETTVRGMDKKLKQKNDDYLVLCDGRGGWKKHGTNRWRERSLSEDEKKIFLQCYLQPSRPSVVMAIRATRITQERRDKQVEGSDTTFRRWLRDYEQKNAGVICLARKGEKAWKDKYGSYITRDMTLLAPCQCLVADGKVLNFFIKHPKTGKKCRMILILFYDWKSGCPVGWQIMPTENTISIMGAFRNAVINMGRYPEMVYLDNGRAFKGTYFTKTDADFDDLNGLYARAGVAVMHAAPYNGRAKVVERFFETFQEQFECFVPSFCGDSIHTKPAHMHRNEKFHQQWHEARTSGWIPTVRDAAKMIDCYFRWYSQNPHRGLDGRRPVDVLAPGMGPGVPVAQLNWDFMWRETVRPRNKRIHLWGIDYEADFLLNMSRSKKLLAMVDTADLHQIYVYTPEGIALGKAEAVQALHPVARLSADEFGMTQVKQAIKGQRNEAKTTKAKLRSLGAPVEMTEALDILPWNQKELIRSNMEEPKAIEAPEPVLSQAEIIEIETAVKEAEKAATKPPAIPRPEYWDSELHHYEYAFALRYEHGQPLTEEDEAFMDYFKKTDEFKKNYSSRFEDLKDLYRVYNTGDQAVAG